MFSCQKWVVISLLILCWVPLFIMVIIQVVDTSGTIYNIFITAYFFLNLSVVSISYGSIWKVIKTTKRRLLLEASDVIRERATRKQLRTAKMMLLIVFLFGLNSLFLVIFFIMTAVDRMISKQILTLMQTESAYAIVVTFSYFTSAVHPIIYIIMHASLSLKLELNNGCLEEQSNSQQLYEHITPW